MIMGCIRCLFGWDQEEKPKADLGSFRLNVAWVRKESADPGLLGIGLDYVLP